MTVGSGTTLQAPLERRFSAAPSLRIVALALGELARGIAGFWIMLACIALGVAVIAGIGALSDGLRAGFERQGKVLLGGDVTLARPHRQVTPEERAWLARQGRYSETATLRTMARRLDGAEQALVELKGVDTAYPLAGALRLEGKASFATIRDQSGGIDRAVVDPILLERLGLAKGDTFQLGRIKVEAAALLAPAGEPDKIADRFTVGPRVFVSLATLARSGLAEPGGLVRWRYAVELAGPSDDAALKAFRAKVKADLPDAGFGIRDRTDPSPALTRTLDRLRQFLTLIGLAALMIGGVGVANAVTAYVDRRRKAIATMKSLGASSRQIFTLHLVQVLALAALGILIGLAAGFLIPLTLAPLIRQLLPVDLELRASLSTLALATTCGVLVALLFSLWPLGRAGEIRAAALFRDDVSPSSSRPPRRVVIAVVLCTVALAALAILTSESRLLAAYFCAGLACVFLVFPGLGALLAWAARRIRRPRRPELALALGSIGAPGGLTRTVVLSLGAGLSLLTAVALIDAGIVRELEQRLPNNAPAYFLLDIPVAEMASLSQTVTRRAPGAEVIEAPMLRGRIVALKGRPVDEVKAPPEAQWVLRGDRGLTYSATLPEHSKLVAGSWWAPDHTGDALVSFDAEIARHLHLGFGDTVTVNVLGRNVTATISNLREIQWESLGLNFVMVFSPNVLAGAPHNLLATIALPPSVSLAEEAAISREIGKAHPSVTVIRVKDAIAAFNAIFSKIMAAVRVAGGVTLIAGALVLAGALATAQRQRIRQAVILKTLGATRRQILTMHLLEYLILSLAAAMLAIVFGALGAFATLTGLMKVPFDFSVGAVAQAVLLAIGLVVTFGLAGTRSILAAPSVPYLKTD